jgi:hypothetical protein
MSLPTSEIGSENARIECAHFPLTPALSLGERENLVTLSRRAATKDSIQRKKFFVFHISSEARIFPRQAGTECRGENRL